MRKKVLAIPVLIVGIPLFALQAVPYGHNHTNPPVRTQPDWGSQEVHDIAVRACYDCHSNETVWPWYSNVAPVSWLVQKDVEEGRRRLNFSELDVPRQREGGSGERGGEREGSEEMPPSQYLLMHPSAKLTQAERQELDQALRTVRRQGVRGG